MYRYLHLEVCIGSLDSYIQEDTRKTNFLWTSLPDLCSQLIDSVIWLHQNDVYFNGKLNPRNILVKASAGSPDRNKRVKLLVPDKLNPFNCLDGVYIKAWTAFQNSDLNFYENSIRKDVASVAILVYFIQSCGNHPFQSGPEFKNDYEDISINITEEQWNVDDKEALDKACFCFSSINDYSENICKNTECKYHVWVNTLAKNWCMKLLMDLSNTTGNILHILNNQSLEKLKDHPFFWKNSTILSFILRSSNYLTDGNNDQIKRIFGWTPPDEAKAVKKGSEKEPQLRFGNYNAGLRINPEAWIEQSIMERLKISYPNIVGHLQ